jgi:hypothetical protein
MSFLGELYPVRISLVRDEVGWLIFYPHGPPPKPTTSSATSFPSSWLCFGMAGWRTNFRRSPKVVVSAWHRGHAVKDLEESWRDCKGDKERRNQARIIRHVASSFGHLLEAYCRINDDALGITPHTS